MKKLYFDNKDTLPCLGLGTYLSKPAEVHSAVLEAIKMGYRHIDCASIYGNEIPIGKAIHEAISSGIVKRQDLFICSKLWNSDHAPEDAKNALEKSLNALQLDYLDLHLMHWPVAFKSDSPQALSTADLLPLEEMPLSLTWNAMLEMKNQGKVKHIGVSNFNQKKIERLTKDTSFKPEVNQIEVHPFFQQNDLVNWCQEQEILVTAFSPLGSRHLAKNTEGILTHPTISDIATKRNCSPAQVLLKWGMQKGLAVIPKTTNIERMKENYCSQSIQLNEDVMLRISKLERGLRMAKGNFCIFPEGAYTSKSIWED